MRTQLQRRLSCLLVIVMAAALLCVPSFAAGNTAPNEYGITNYVALGDSIATGLNDNNGTNSDAYGSWEVGYTTLLAGRLGLLDGAESYVPDGYNMRYYTSPNASGFHSWAFPAMRTREILHQVDASYNYEKDDFAYLWLDNNELDESLGDVRTAQSAAHHSLGDRRSRQRSDLRHDRGSDEEQARLRRRADTARGRR